MSEKPPGQIPPSVEEKVEHIPTAEEVHEVLARMLKGGEYRITGGYEDEKGPCRIDAIGAGTEEGETLELFYLRKGSYPNGDSAAETEIHSTYMKDSSWNGTGPQASLIDGNWKIVD